MRVAISFTAILLAFSLAALSGGSLPPGERILGSAQFPNTKKGADPRIVTWGDKLRLWNANNRSVKEIAGLQSLGPGGCIGDLDGDGSQDLILQHGSDLLWLRGPNWEKPEQIDNGIDFRDCRVTVLFGARGLLITQRYAQVRFYQRPETPQKRWPYQEIYSIYTPSKQGSLLTYDVNEDGLPDIFCGNYWIRSPEGFDLPWRLFAIELYNEKPDSALVRLALAQIKGSRFPALVVSEGAADHGRLAWFERPDDPRQLWIEHRLLPDETLHHPQGLLVLDEKGDMLVGEDNGPESRLFHLENEHGNFKSEVIHRGTPARELYRYKKHVALVSEHGFETIEWEEPKS